MISSVLLLWFGYRKNVRQAEASKKKHPPLTTRKKKKSR